MSFDLEASWATLETLDQSGHTQHFNGLQIWKTKDDMARYERVIQVRRPELVIETGTRWGGFAVWIAERFAIDVISIDVQPTRTDAARHPRVTLLQANSVDFDLIDGLPSLVAGRRTMVTLDSDHHYEHVLEEIRHYRQFVTVGQSLVIEDGIADMVASERARVLGRGIPERGGPLKAIERAMADGLLSDFQHDAGIEGMTAVTHHPMGWWARVY